MLGMDSWRVGVMVVALYPSCSNPQIAVRYGRDDDQRLSWSEQRVIRTIADATVTEVRPLLPTLPVSLILRVEPRTLADSETGEAVAPRPPATIYWMIDLAWREGVTAIAQAHFRASLAHGLYYLARRAAGHSDESLREEAVSIGLATVFARELTGSTARWGLYPNHVNAWARELLALPPETRPGDWMSRHPDGRLWVGQKVGTYLVDRAVKVSGRSIAELVSASADEIILLASEP
jgi:hypothetical protein